MNVHGFWTLEEALFRLGRPRVLGSARTDLRHLLRCRSPSSPGMERDPRTLHVGWKDFGGREYSATHLSDAEAPYLGGAVKELSFNGHFQGSAAHFSSGRRRHIRKQ
jgi:hypothetical protein